MTEQAKPQTIVQTNDTPNLNSLINYNVTDAAITALAEKYERFPTDLSVKDNYDIVKSGVSEVRTLRSEVESRRKDLKKDALEYGRKVDSAANGIKERLLAIETPMKEAKKEFDTKQEIEKREIARKEEERVDTIQSNIASIRSLVEANISSPSSNINDIITGLGKEDPKLWADEFAEKAGSVITETLNKLKELYTMKFNAEMAAEVAEQEREEREANEAAARKEREEENTRVAAENATKEAELAKERKELARMKAELEAAEVAQQKALDDATKAKEEAINKVKEAKEEKERLARIEEQRVKMAEIAKRNMATSKAITIKIMEGILTNDGPSATMVVDAIMEDKFDHIKWVD